ncbi:AAA family ATPase [Vibrio splendidus]|uniref:AAA family ATPase n=1 Tax=Vibrio splendidus TaxID=29497 RepID=UPI002735D830|nr:AAA family ATPase [Vibrio splendidus]MDP2588247.1 AAA family ATPase [Vibrio splendidus]
MSNLLRCYIRVTTAYGLRSSTYRFNGMFVRRGDYINRVSAKSFVTVEVSEKYLNAEPRAGQVWELLGIPETKVVEHNGYELTQCHFVNPEAKMVLPETVEEFIQFIAKEPDFEGIGEVKARKIFEKFGVRLFSMLEAGIHKEISDSFTPLLAKNLIEGYRKYENLRHAMYFAEMGIPPSVQAKLFKFHKSEAVQEIKKNPYLLQYFGTPFSVVDKLATKSFDVDSYDARRMNAIVERAMHKHCKEGHTVASIDDLWHLVVEVCEGDENLAEDCILNASSSLAIYYDEHTENIHHTGLYIMEGVISKRINHLVNLRNGWCLGADEAYSNSVAQFEFPLTEKQGEAIIQSLEHHVFTLTGGAGTGKTTVMKAIVDSYMALGFKIYGVALSGRAAKRLHESILIETQTIQRFLMLDDEVVCSDDSILLVIDEASMVDIPSLYKLIIKLPKHARIIFAGDDEQLPPIGAGLVLSELIKSGVVARTHLDVVRRQRGETGIPVYSDDIRNARVPKELNYKNIHFIPTHTCNIVNDIVDLYLKLIVKGEVQVISPTRKIAREVNEQCQLISNPYGKKLLITTSDGMTEDVGIRLGDPVIFTKNNYKVDIQNGTLGKVVGLHDKDNKSVLAKVEIDTGRIVEITFDLLDDMDLAYAITLHKAQGSQFVTVIAPVFNNRLIDKSWIYTANTRATESMYWLGSESAFRSAITSQTKASQRNVYLAKLLRQNV